MGMWIPIFFKRESINPQNENSNMHENAWKYISILGNPERLPESNLNKTDLVRT